MKKRNFIFDLGNILIEWNKDKILESVLLEEERSLFDDAIFQSGLWENLDEGVLSIEDLEKQLIQILGKKYHRKIQTILWEWYDYVDTYPEIYEMIARLKEKGCSIYILSNTSKLFYKILDEKLFDLRPVLDGFVISCEIKQMKPNEEMYRYLLDKYHLLPEESIFFDDLSVNVQGARNIGIEAYQISNRHNLWEKLNQLL